MQPLLSYPEKRVPLPSDAIESRFGWLRDVAVGVIFKRDSLRSVAVEVRALNTVGGEAGTEDLQDVEWTVRLENNYPVIAVGFLYDRVRVAFKDGEICDIIVAERCAQRYLHLRHLGLIKTAGWSPDGKLLACITEDDEYILSTPDNLIKRCSVRESFPKASEDGSTVNSFPSLRFLDDGRLSVQFTSVYTDRNANLYIAGIADNESPTHVIMNNGIRPVKADSHAAFVISRAPVDAVVSVDRAGTFRENLDLSHRSNTFLRNYHAVAWDDELQLLFLQTDRFLQVWKRRSGRLWLLRQFDTERAAYYSSTPHSDIIVKRKGTREILVLCLMQGAIKLLSLYQGAPGSCSLESPGLELVTTHAEIIKPHPFTLEYLGSLWCCEHPPAATATSPKGHFIVALHEKEVEVVHKCPKQVLPALVLSLQFGALNLTSAIFSTDGQLFVLGRFSSERTVLLRVISNSKGAVAISALRFQPAVSFLGSSSSHLAFLCDDLSLVSFDIRGVCSNAIGKTVGLQSHLQMLPSSNKGFQFCSLLEDRLLLGNKCLSVGCTSYLICKNVLFYTVGEGSLFAFDLHREQLLYSRFIERGAVINHIRWKLACVVMELPRGSLEMVYPQFLLRSSVQSDIEHKRYSVAFKRSLLHRVDMTDLLIRSLIAHPDYLTSFLASLSKKQYIESFVLGLKKKHAPDSADRILEGIHGILVRSELHNMDLVAVVLLALSADNLPTVTRMIVSAWSSDNENLVSRAISKLLEHCHFDGLFRVVLDFGELDFALFLTQRSECDKPTYALFLRDIATMDRRERCIAIADYLGDHKKSLGLLPLDDEVSYRRFREYVQKHGLYAYGASDKRLSDSQRRDICLAFAEHLYSNENYYAAGIVYESLAELHQSLTAYCLGLHWQEAFFVTHLLQMTVNDQRKLAVDFIERLTAARDFRAASCVATDYLHDKQAALSLLCKGCYYTEAYRLAVLVDDDSSVDSIDHSLLEECKSLIFAMQQMIAEGKGYIRTVAQFGAMTVPDDVSWHREFDIPDNLSLNSAFTNSTTSSFSNSSLTSGHSQRRAKKMRRKWKAGSLYEKEHTLHAMKILYQRREELQGEVLKIGPSLVRRQFRDASLQLRTVFLEYMGVLHQISDYIGNPGLQQNIDFSYIV
ncbi:hypothetical protein BJ508DRAFT_414545 [Ascobolus immersus RN42]|uniref:ELP1 TPR domain-containing protein n=1 Tax=Ascobolus immersus RN42 TaxID=1160509 RepID=A0A3N4I6X6_ASCIM|nr:hypothetical protein BJ508DRAFT_414545 [Ascobolus immersus RN42]